MLDDLELIPRIVERTGAPDAATARRALDATLLAIASSLSVAEAVVLAAELSPAMADQVRAAPRRDVVGERDAFSALADLEGVPRTLAVEYAHVICQLLAEHLDGDVQILLRRRLPSPWADLFHPHAATTPIPPRTHHHAPPVGEGHTLASGRPGSRHAVADHPAERAHADSVARNDNPHGDEKLSSGAPRAEPLATAQADPSRRISEGES